ncbi:MAG: TlyA family RNA methyltransferase [Anaerolineaceae bacterium]|nr:TlyA family RNA methyltransferase [Anaerolineaceae bacterium]
MQRQRLDLLLTERGMVESRTQAQRLVMAGQVRVQGQVVLKPDMRIAIDSELVVEQGPPFVSRGGEKLEAALQAFNLHPLTDQICVDVGASTGGFTDCLLQHGAAKVYAVDVGYGVLHWKLRNDRRVISMERTNARFIEDFPEPVQLVTVDASFISLRILLPVIKKWFKGQDNRIVALIKPQFEAGRQDAARGEGVIRDPLLHRQILISVLDFALSQDLCVKGLIRSPLLGPKGNTEFLVYLISANQSQSDLESLVDALFI